MNIDLSDDFLAQSNRIRKMPHNPTNFQNSNYLFSSQARQTNYHEGISINTADTGMDADAYADADVDAYDNFRFLNGSRNTPESSISSHQLEQFKHKQQLMQKHKQRQQEQLMQQHQHQHQHQHQYQRQLLSNNNMNNLPLRMAKIQQINNSLHVLYEQLNTSNLIFENSIDDVFLKIKEMCDEHNKKINDWFDENYYNDLKKFNTQQEIFIDSSTQFANNYPLKFG